MFYEDQHKLAAYLERTGAAFACKASNGEWVPVDPKANPPRICTYHYEIRPVLRYGLPSHLQSEIHNPDNLTEEQICEGGKYRAITNTERQDPRLNEGVKVWNARWNTRNDGGSYGYRIERDDITYCVSANVPWHDWELTKATPWPEWPDTEDEKPGPKDARIAELEKQVSELHESCETLRETCSKIASPWRRMSEVPTEEDKKSERFLGRWLSGEVELIDYRSFDTCVRSNLYAAWMPVPKFHGWPDPLADLLKSHDIEATPELTAALTAWKKAQQ